jgi:isoamylase
MNAIRRALVLSLVVASACAGPHGEVPDDPTPRPDAGRVGTPDDAGAGPTDPWAEGPPLGARLTAEGDLEVRARAPSATRLELCVFAAAFGEKERLRLAMDHEGDMFSLRVSAEELSRAGITGVVYYGLRAFGPNWPHDPAFEPGSLAGFVADVDEGGHRMNPNKLLLDPYALEMSHDPIHEGHRDHAVYRTGEAHRAIDSGPFAPKGIVVAPPSGSRAAAPTRALADDVVYEVHVRGLTMSDPDVSEDERGTYAGAARRAKYLRALGVTAIELLPLHETPNDQNDLTPDASGKNYWGYSTLSYLAPDRRYARDRSPGGPTRELRAMVEAFHAEGIKVFVDVVYNHTSEGGANGDAATLYSLRGLDNATFYQLADDPRTYVNGNGVGPNVNTAHPVTGDLVLASLRYWHESLGVDGFRFDLASIVGNGCTRGCYRFDPAGLLTRIAEELPARSEAGGAGADLVAEPWGLAPGSYQLGSYPRGWSEWNDRYRDTVRRDLNRYGVEDVTPRELARRIGGSPDLFAGRAPSASVNFVVAHDGMTLADLFSYDQKQNSQPWPYGPSDGGTSNDLAHAHGGDPIRQRSVARTAFALLALSAGVPMLTGGDERLRTQRGNNNAYNLDSVGNWLDWSPDPVRDAFAGFAARALAFRHAHPALRPRAFWPEAAVTWLRDDGSPADATYLDAADRHFLAWRLDGARLGDPAKAIYVAYNGWTEAVTATLPAPPAGTSYRLVADTSAVAAAWGNWTAPGSSREIASGTYAVAARSLVVAVAE